MTVDCDASLRRGNDEFLRRLNSEGRRLCIPMTGSLALTHRCNLKCLHCYAGPGLARQNRAVTGCREPSTERWVALIDEIAEAGCLFLLLTGGEPLVRPDFDVIYRHAKESGLLVTVFTNGTLVDGRILDLLSDLPPQAVEISLYGATAATHDKISGVEGSFERALHAIGRLLERGVRLRLKSVLMRLNMDEFADIRRLAEETYGVAFRMDAAIMPRLNGDRGPLELRVPPDVAADLEMAHADTRRKWQKAFHQSGQVTASPRLYTCGAGVIGFHIDGDGQLLPCLMTTDVTCDLHERTFAEGWKTMVDAMAGKMADPALECRSCAHGVMCGVCPSYALLENGRANSKPEYLCELGRCRRERLERRGVPNERA